MSSQPLRAPEPPERPVRRTVHGVEITDPYAWLRAPNWRAVLRDPAALPAEIQAHLLAENAYADAVLAPVEPLRRRVLAEMRGRLAKSEASAPRELGAWTYVESFEPGADHPVVRRRQGERDEAVLDVAALARGAAFFDLSEWRPSPTNAHLAYGVDRAAAELFTLRVRDLATGRDLDDRLDDTAGRVVWARDGQAFLYVAVGEDHRPSRVLLHRLGAPPSEDLVLHDERDPAWPVWIGQTGSGRFATLTLRRSDETEIRLVDLDDPTATPRLVESRRAGLRYDVDHGGGGDLVIRTDRDGAVDGKLVTAPVEAPEPENWRDLVPHQPGVTIVAHRAFPGHVAWLERENALGRIVVLDRRTGRRETLAFRDEVLALSLDPSWGAPEGSLRLTLSSPVRPPETLDQPVAGGQRRVVKRQELDPPLDPERFASRRIWARAPDGEGVPVSLVYRRDLPLDGTSPCLLHAYGSYGWAIQPMFLLERVPLLERGFVYAVAHVRGGADRGQRWYEAAKFQGKPHTFTDFIAAAEAVIAQGLTRPGRIVAHGRSAGGMLMGAVANMAPLLFAGIIADVPFVDVLNTTLDEELPLTPTEWLEWGDPIRDPAMFEAIQAYSPYDNLRPQLYPPILATGGLADPRVTYWEPAKWIARLRRTGTGGPFLLRTNMAAGHAGTEGRFSRLDEAAGRVAFALRCVGLSGA